MVETKFIDRVKKAKERYEEDEDIRSLVDYIEWLSDTMDAIVFDIPNHVGRRIVEEAKKEGLM